MNYRLPVGLAIALGTMSMASANTVYNVNLSIGATGNAIGTITTDGTTGPLGLSNILDWHLSVSDGVHTTDTLLGPLSGNNSFDTFNQHDQAATPTTITFNFSNSDAGYFFFENAGGFLCFGSAGVCGGAPGNVEGISVQGNLQNTVLTGTQVIASNTQSSVPEPSTIALILAGAVTVLLRRSTFRSIARLPATA
jgi:hypothetical protein